MILIWSIIGISIVGYLVYRLTAAGIQPETTNKVIAHHGPFTIQIEFTAYGSYSMNTGRSNKQTLNKYSVLYNDKPVQFSNNLQNNTGFSHLWKVYILKDAPTPTLIAGSQSMYLINENNGVLHIEALDQQGYDFATLQWLDGDHEQPSAPITVFMNNDTSRNILVDTVQGGNYLLVNNHTVLQLNNLKITPVNKNNEPVSNYAYGTKAIAFSPNSAFIVFIGEFQTWNTDSVPEYSMALIIHDISKNIGTVLPFSKNQTKVYHPNAINASWFNTYFAWNKKGNELILEQKKLKQPLPWQGTFAKMDSDASEYHLYPVSSDLLPVFKDFILSELHWGETEIIEFHKENENHYVDSYQFGKDKIKFGLSFHDSQIELYRSLPNDSGKETNDQIIALGKSFNTFLQKGNYQLYFTEIPENDD
ncbi:MAG: hypothetical protein ABIR66_03890 [Saprospiraceae bacterium]